MFVAKQINWTEHAQVASKDLFAYYCACIRSLLDYACTVFHHSLPNYLHADLERVQRRDLACIFPGKPYAEVLSIAELSLLHTSEVRTSAITIASARTFTLEHKRHKQGCLYLALTIVLTFFRFTLEDF